MFEHNEKLKNYLFFFSAIVSSLVICLDAVVYTLAIPKMVDYFKVDSEKLMYLTRMRYAGLIVCSLFIGSLEKVYGKRLVLLWGLFLLTVSAFVFALSNHFLLSTITSFFIGAGKAVPSVIFITLLMEKFSLKDFNRLFIILQIIVLVFITVSPSFMAFIIDKFSWRYPLYFVFCLCLISFLTAVFFVEESKNFVKETNFSFQTTLNNYKFLLFNFKYMAYSLIYILPPLTIKLCQSNFPIILVKNMDLSLVQYALDNSVITIITAVFSSISLWLVSKKGIEFNMKCGFFLFLFSSLWMLVFWLYTMSSELERGLYFDLIFISLYICAASQAMMSGFFVKATSAVPELKTYAVSFSVIIGNAINARFLYRSQEFYDGTISPVVILITFATFIGVVLYSILKSQEKELQKESQSN